MKIALIGLIIGFMICVVIAPLCIKITRKMKFGQNILSYVDKHSAKQGTPTMGGTMFVISLIILYFVLGGYKYVLPSVLVVATCAYALLGFLDDYLKIRHKQNEGLKAYQKAVGQFGIAIILAIFMYKSPLIGDGIVVPFSFDEFNVSFWIIIFSCFVFLAVTNAVNLTDGLDGLAGSVGATYLASFGVILFIYIGKLSGNGVGGEITQELLQVCYLIFAFTGALLGYICFNSYPAKIFMGDTGSLAIGGFIACSMAITKLYLYMPLIGLMFVLSTISVIMQVGYFKLTHKRIFKMAPLHHHFEQNGVHETKIVAIYIIITIVLGALCIAFSIS